LRAGSVQWKLVNVIAEPRFWNIWWTLTVISAALTLVVLMMEGLGWMGGLRRWMDGSAG
jgi:hypothetical protein